MVLAPNAGTDWEQEINRPVVVKRPDGYHLWYTGEFLGQVSAIGHAWSQDGNCWERTGPRPVLSADQPWEMQAVMCPHVIWDGQASVYKMWYSGGEQYEPNAIGYATSPDGLSWQKHSRNPVFTPSGGREWERHKVTACQVIFHRGEYLMFYIGFENEHHAQIGLARSPDGIGNWERHPANPLIRSGRKASTWDHDAVYKPFALFDETQERWLLWYNGRSGHPEQIGLAVHKGEKLWPD